MGRNFIIVIMIEWIILHVKGLERIRSLPAQAGRSDLDPTLLQKVQQRLYNVSMVNSLNLSKAFSDRNRLKILNMLSRNDMKVGEVAGDLDVEENLASHHLRVLSALGFLRSSRKGREVFYKINRSKLVSIVRDLSKNKLFKDILEEGMGNK